MTTSCLSILPCPEMQAERSSLSGQIGSVQAWGSPSFLWPSQKSQLPFERGWKRTISQVFGVHLQAGLRLYPYHNVRLLLCPGQSSTRYGDVISASEDTWKVLQDGYFLVILDSRRHQAAANLLRTAGEHLLDPGHLCMSFIPSRDGVGTKQAKATDLREIRNAS